MVNDTSRDDKVYDEKDIGDLLWSFLPEEESYGHGDYDFYPTLDCLPSLSKREEFIVNSDKLSVILTEAYFEVKDEYMEDLWFLQGNGAKNIRVESVERGSTCIRFWK